MIELFDEVYDTLSYIAEGVVPAMLKICIGISFPLWIIPYLIIKARKEKSDNNDK